MSCYCSVIVVCNVKKVSLVSCQKVILSLAHILDTARKCHMGKLSWHQFSFHCNNIQLVNRNAANVNKAKGCTLPRGCGGVHLPVNLPVKTITTGQLVRICLN